MKRKITDDVLEKMRKLEDDGLSRKEIAKKCGCCTRTVSRYLGFKPVDERACTKIRYDTAVAMKRLYQEGWKKSDIASMFNVHYTTVHRVFGMLGQ